MTQVPLLVLTHFHADHVDGLEGALDGRQVGLIESTRVLDPTEGVEDVLETAQSHGLVVTPATQGLASDVGEVRLQTLWPTPGAMSSRCGRRQPGQ